MNSLQNVTTFSIRYSLRTTLSHFKKQVHISAACKSTSSTEDPAKESVNYDKPIVIPDRIERSSTDILKALSSTVKRDYTAPHYKYHDDPFLTPTNNLHKRAYALSQESGRKAARWIRQEHADLFQHKVADPPVEAFFPQAVYDENSHVDEAVLKKVITLHQVSDSLTIYGLLEKKGTELSRDTKQSLLELLCYYNSQDTLEEEWIEERWFRQGSRIREKKMNVWKKGGPADKLFESLAPHDSAVYAAFLCGKAQAGDVDGAYRLFLAAQDNNIILPTEAFNKLIAGASVLKEGHELRWQFVEEMLGVMNQQGVSPDISTLNSILETISTMSVNKDSQQLSLKVMAEFRAMGIKASLASYNFLLRIFSRDRRSQGNSTQVNILGSILDLLEGKSFQIQDPRDVLFFSEAMDVCRFQLSDVRVAIRLDKLLHTGDNYNFIGDSYKESIYYRNYFGLICEMGTLQDLMDLYNKLVPNVYVPEPGIMEEILKTVELCESWQLLPKLWSDIVMFDQAGREETLVLVLSILCNSRDTDPDVSTKLADIAWDIWQRVENQREDRMNKKISWTGDMLGNVLTMLLRAGRYEQSLQIVDCLERRQSEIVGVPAVESLAAFLDKSIELNQVNHALWCIQYCSDGGYEATLKLAQKLYDSGLSEEEQKKLFQIVGSDFLSKEAVSSS